VDLEHQDQVVHQDLLVLVVLVVHLEHLDQVVHLEHQVLLVLLVWMDLIVVDGEVIALLVVLQLVKHSRQMLLL
jgi:hypothetical protein